jgi:hypothetical protein
MCGRKADPADGLLEQSAHEAWDAAGDEKVWSALSKSAFPRRRRTQAKTRYSSNPSGTQTQNQAAMACAAAGSGRRALILPNHP